MNICKDEHIRRAMTAFTLAHIESRSRITVYATLKINCLITCRVYTVSQIVHLDTWKNNCLPKRLIKRIRSYKLPLKYEFIRSM